MALHVLKCKVVSAAIDWITLTSSSKKAQRSLWSVGNRVLNLNEAEGQHPARWHAHGYEGWTNGSCSLGARKDGCILRLSSQQAANHWLDAFRTAENCSRLDLAVDCELDAPVPALSRQIYRDAGHVAPVLGRPPARRLIVSGDGGSTVYIGARASEQFGRCYDKGIESKTRQAGFWWRWEVEYKGAHSFALADALSRTDDHRVAAMSNVAHWWRTRTHHTYSRSDIRFSILLSREVTTIDRQLSWLSSSVRPTVQKLLELVPRERVLSALGIPPQSAVSPGHPVTPLKESA